MNDELFEAFQLLAEAAPNLSVLERARRVGKHLAKLTKAISSPAIALSQVDTVNVPAIAKASWNVRLLAGVFDRDMRVVEAEHEQIFEVAADTGAAEADRSDREAKLKFAQAAGKELLKGLLSGAFNRRPQMLRKLMGSLPFVGTVEQMYGGASDLYVVFESLSISSVQHNSPDIFPATTEQRRRDYMLKSRDIIVNNARSVSKALHDEYKHLAGGNSSDVDWLQNWRARLPKPLVPPECAAPAIAYSPTLEERNAVERIRVHSPKIAENITICLAKIERSCAGTNT